jgi:hypothetical protein
MGQKPTMDGAKAQARALRAAMQAEGRERSRKVRQVPQRSTSAVHRQHKRLATVER